MRKLLLACCFVIVFQSLTFIAGAQDLSYYLPDSVSYNPAIPKPKDVIFHEVGQWHVTHDRLVNYMKITSGWKRYGSNMCSLRILPVRGH